MRALALAAGLWLVLAPSLAADPFGSWGRRLLHGLGLMVLEEVPALPRLALPGVPTGPFTPQVRLVIRPGLADGACSLLGAGLAGNLLARDTSHEIGLLTRLSEAMAATALLRQPPGEYSLEADLSAAVADIAAAVIAARAAGQPLTDAQLAFLTLAAGAEAQEAATICRAARAALLP